MKLIPRHTKSIEIEFTNLNTKDICFRITIPLTHQRDLQVSKLYKRLKPAIAYGEKVEQMRIAAKHQIIDSEKIGRILFEWRGGVALDMPDDATPFDYSIILAQLDVIKMKFKQPPPSPPSNK